jgi:taurine dioxygenase
LIARVGETRKATVVILRDNVARKTHSSLIEAIPTDKALGAAIPNVDLRSFDDWQFAAFMRALLRHQAVLVRGQTLNDRELIAFCRRFGVVGCAPDDGDHRSNRLREIHIASRARPNTEPGTSVTPLAIARVASPIANVLYVSDGASLGALTTFCSLYAIYDALPPGLRGRIAHLRIRHGGEHENGLPAQTGPSAISGSLVQPLVSTHPDTGRSMLHLGRRHNASLLGLTKDESDELLDELWQFVERPEFAWEHAPQIGDLLMWDNRCTLHRRHRFDPACANAALENSARRL